VIQLGNAVVENFRLMWKSHFDLLFSSRILVICTVCQMSLISIVKCKRVLSLVLLKLDKVSWEWF